MHGTNPYAQAGWYNPANPLSIDQQHPGSTSSSQPPTFGALPYPNASNPHQKYFVFTSQGKGIIHGCEVMDPASHHTMFKIQMAHDGLDYTTLQYANGTRVGYVVWKPQGPEVEVHGSVAKQKGKSWLPLAPDKSSRFMEFNGKHYTWQFARDAMYFYDYVLNRHQQLAKVYPVKDGTTVFEASEALVNNGMLESVVLAIVLLLSERFRD